jgi:formylmethanofuran dehydrogenase subunit A
MIYAPDRLHFYTSVTGLVDMGTVFEQINQHIKQGTIVTLRGKYDEEIQKGTIYVHVKTSQGEVILEESPVGFPSEKLITQLLLVQG